MQHHFRNINLKPSKIEPNAPFFNDIEPNEPYFNDIIIMI